MRKHKARCRSCGAIIIWKPYPTTGKMHPFNPDGSSHFGTCPDAQRWRQKQISKNQLTLFD